MGWRLKFTSPLIVEHLKASRFIKLVEPFSYGAITVPAGFVCDGASIPKLFWSFVGSPFDKFLFAAVLHDWCCTDTENFTRKEADDLFLEAMEELGIPMWKRDIMWRAVSLLQRGHYTDIPEHKLLGD